jgi:branched-chain amino acid transport system ATP-binding protein
LSVDRNYRAVLAHIDRAVVPEKRLIVMDGSSSDLVPDHEALGA